MTASQFNPRRVLRCFVRVLEAAGYRAVLPAAQHGARPLCCGRTFLAAESEQGTLALDLIPDLVVETVPSSCCGMAGAFGYEATHCIRAIRLCWAPGEQH